jgi:AcrR family transcriptional regulator
VQTTAVRDADLTARARIREHALALFAQRGVAGTSMRKIAESAGVSPALVVHHFGSKDGLVRAVDDAVADLFRAQLAQLDPAAAPEVFSAEAGEAFGRVIGSNPTLRQYLRRSLLEDSSHGAAFVDQLLAWTQRGIDALNAAGGLRPDSNPRWRAYQVLFVVLGPLLLEPLLQRHAGPDAFAPDVVAERSRANHDFFARGLLGTTAPRARKRSDRAT